MAAKKTDRVEEVMTGGEPDKKDKKKKSDKKKDKKKGPHEIRVRHGASGGYIAEHHSHPAEADNGNTLESEHVIPDIDSLHSHVDDHMQEPTADVAAAAPPPAPVPPPAAAGPPIPGM